MRTDIEQDGKNPLVCISIVHWHCPNELETLLGDIAFQSYANFFVVVVNNGPKGIFENNRPAAGESLHIIEAKENIGFAGAHRIAIEFGRKEGCDFFWLLNPDLRLERDALATMIQAYCKQPDAIFGSLPLEGVPRNAKSDAKIAFATKFLRMPYREFRPMNRKPMVFRELGTETTREVASVPGCAMGIPRKVIEKHGCMDESFFMYGEEIDYCFRMRRIGIPSLLVTNSVVWRRKNNRSSDLEDAMTYYRCRNTLRRIYRHNPSFSLILHALGQASVGIGTSWRRSGRMKLLGIWHACKKSWGKTVEAPAPSDETV